MNFSVVTDKVSHYGTLVRHGLTVLGGALMGFGIASQVQVDQLTGAFDAIQKGVLAIADTASGVVGAVTAIAAIVASIKGNIKFGKSDQ